MPKGRILLVGTTNLDACQPVIWNMGKIAASGAPGALHLFRTILLASAAVPGAFPPSMIRVEVDGEIYEEMHVDGGPPRRSSSTRRACVAWRPP
jgi:predicted acylesterase/phospholipase RssA